MHRHLLILLLLLISGSAQAQDVDFSQIDPLVETRAIWIDAGGIPKTEAEIRNLVRSYSKMNLNVLFPEVVARGYTVYKSEILERDPRFEGAIDPLPIIIDEAHKLGMEVHPWVWVFRAGYTKDKGAILRAHPDWVELNKFGEALSANGGLWLSPAHPDARDFLAKLFAELVRKYNVDGLHLDYIRYEVESPTPYGYSPVSRAKFEEQYGIDPLNIDRLSFSQYEWNKFRERQISTFVQRISLQTKRIKPDAKISAAVGSVPETARLRLMQNWPHWAVNKWVDFLTPMTYTGDNEKFTRFVMEQKDAVDSITLLAPGIGLHTQKKSPETTVEQIAITRRLLTTGQTLFSTSHLFDIHEAALITGPYDKPASVPFRDPALKSSMIRNLSECLAQYGATDLAEYFSERADVLNKYAQYQIADIGYIPPTLPPLDIPNYVIPLPEVSVPRITQDIVIDGQLTEDVWQIAAQVELEYTNEGEPAPVETTAFLAYDDENLYVAFRSQESLMRELKATVEKRDGPTFYDDSVELFIDPTQSERTYYHLSTNLLGTRFDQKVFNAGWNADWKTASTKGEDVWFTEVAVPFEALGVDEPQSGASWNLNLTRNRATADDLQHLTWAVPYDSFHSPDRFGTITFE